MGKAPTRSPALQKSASTIHTSRSHVTRPASGPDCAASNQPALCSHSQSPVPCPVWGFAQSKDTLHWLSAIALEGTYSHLRLLASGQQRTLIGILSHCNSGKLWLLYNTPVHPIYNYVRFNLPEHHESPMNIFISRMSAMTPRRFAPLNPGTTVNSAAPRLKGIVFDVDGTLWYVFLEDRSHAS